MPVERGIKSEPAEAPETRGPETGAELSDPFAVDLFAASRPAAADAATLAAEDLAARAHAAGRAWHSSLPKISREEARRSALLAALPPSLSADAREALARTLSRLARAGEGGVRLDVLGTREASAAEFAQGAGAASSRPAAPRLFLTFGVEPEGGRIVAALDADFAAAVVDRLLGGDGAISPASRQLSPTERTVVEFFFLSAVGELNALAGEPLLRLESAGTDFRGAGGGGERVLVTTVRAALGQTVGLARLLFDEAALAALDVAANPLLARASAAARAGAKLDAYRRVAADVPLRLALGETHIAASDLAELERGDIVIVERTAAGVGPGRVGGRLALRAGAGRGFMVGGVVASAPRDGGSGGDEGALALAVEAVSGGDGEGAEGERIEMEDEARTEAGAVEGAAALEGLLLTLHVELPARRISLEELSRLRAGQILELGCRPTDPVELVADGRRVAAGELVDIEGRLGVRVTRLLG